METKPDLSAEGQSATAESQKQNASLGGSVLSVFSAIFIALLSYLVTIFSCYFSFAVIAQFLGVHSSYGSNTNQEFYKLLMVGVVTCLVIVGVSLFLLLMLYRIIKSKTRSQWLQFVLVGAAIGLVLGLLSMGLCGTLMLGSGAFAYQV